MILKKNNVSLRQKIIEGKVKEFRVICPSIVDKMLEITDKRFKVCDILENNFNLCKMHKDSIRDIVFILSMISAKAKKMFATTDVGVALTSPYLLDKYKLTIKNDSSIMTEGNVRNFINKVKCSKLTEGENEKKKSGALWIEYFNLVAKEMLKCTKNTNVHILDCVKIPVNLKNSRYELSTVTNYEGEKIRGYKLGVMRRVTESGGLIEYIIDGTVKDNDLKLVEEKISKLDLIKENEIVIMDRGFIDIEFILKLHRRKVKVIIPAKSNMTIYQNAVKEAIKRNKWKKHPNAKRKEQEIAIVEDLKGIWVPKKDRTKKPGKAKSEEISFNACVIRISKRELKNKKIAEALKKDNNMDDENYVYIVILSTDRKMSDSEIVRNYEQRPEIEEDFRQIKDQWDLSTFTSTKYKYIMCHICMVLLGYNIFSMYKGTEEGEEYRNRNMKSIEKQQGIKFYGKGEVFMMAISNKLFGLYGLGEFLLIFSECNSKIQKDIAYLFT